MFKNSLDKKPLFKKVNGDEIRDLTSTMFNLNVNNYIKYEIYRVPKEFEMRPDLISASAYNDTGYVELILKFNGISNGLTIKEGDVLLIPSLDSMRDIIKTNESKTGSEYSNSIRSAYRYIDPIKIPKVDDTFKNRQLLPTKGKSALPPNISEENEKQITYRNGRVYFGEGVDTCLTSGMTQSEFITNIIKTRRNKV